MPSSALHPTSKSDRPRYRATVIPWCPPAVRTTELFRVESHWAAIAGKGANPNFYKPQRGVFKQTSTEVCGECFLLHWCFLLHYLIEKNHVFCELFHYLVYSTPFCVEWFKWQEPGCGVILQAGQDKALWREPGSDRARGGQAGLWGQGCDQAQPEWQFIKPGCRWAGWVSRHRSGCTTHTR